MAMNGVRTLVAVILMVTWISHFATSAPSTGPSQRLLTFLSLFNGRFQNGQEVDEEKKLKAPIVHDLLTFNYQPVQIPAFPTSLTLLMQEFIGVKEETLRNEIFEVSESPDGLIQITKYSFLNSDKTPFDLKILATLKREDFKEKKGCGFPMKQMDDNVFYGQWPDCTDFNGKTLDYHQVVVSCNTFSGVSHAGEFEKPDIIPYAMRNTGVRYPLTDFSSVIGDVKNFQRPC